MKVFEFMVGESDTWIDWVVAENKESALMHLREFSDMGDEEYDPERACKELTEKEIKELKFYIDEELDEATAMSFAQAIAGREAEMPFHLCSQVD